MELQHGLPQRNLKMVGSFTSDGDVELAADLATLRELVERLSDKALLLSFKLYIPTTAPAPYDDYLEGLTFRAGEGLLNMEVIGKVLSISGSKENIQTFSDNIQWLIEQIEDDETLAEVIIEQPSFADDLKRDLAGQRIFLFEHAEYALAQAPVERPGGVLVGDLKIGFGRSHLDVRDRAVKEAQFPIHLAQQP
jgi:hypothetical protein